MIVKNKHRDIRDKQTDEHDEVIMFFHLHMAKSKKEKNWSGETNGNSKR